MSHQELCRFMLNIINLIILPFIMHSLQKNVIWLICSSVNWLHPLIMHSLQKKCHMINFLICELITLPFIMHSLHKNVILLVFSSMNWLRYHSYIMHSLQKNVIWLIVSHIQKECSLSSHMHSWTLISYLNAIWFSQLCIMNGNLISSFFVSYALWKVKQTSVFGLDLLASAVMLLVDSLSCCLICG